MSTQVPLTRTISLQTAASLVIGGVIGSGIFMRPAEMAALLGSPMLILVVWVVAGTFTFFSAMICAEIGAMFPETGGQYMYLRHIYGEFWAYLFGWANFAVINTAGTAAITFIFAQYAEYFITLPRFSLATEHSFVLHLPMIGDILPLENAGVKGLTIVTLGILSLIGYISTKTGGALQRVLTYAKVLAIVLLVFGLFFSGKGNFAHFMSDGMNVPAAGVAMMTALVAACNGALQAYDGWAIMLTVGGEIKNPRRNIPKSLVLGLFVCMIIYILITASMLYILPVDQMASSSLVAADAARQTFGYAGGGIIAALICLNVLGTSNGNVFTAPRMTFAMAQQGKFFSAAGVIHSKYQTPGNAFLIHFIWMFIMVLSGSFYILSDMYIFIVWLFNLLLVGGIFILRKRMPDAERPYKIPGYPYMPALVLIFNAFYLVVTLYNDISNYNAGKTHVINSVFGLALTAIGIPLYFFFRKKNDSSVLVD